MQLVIWEQAVVVVTSLRGQYNYCQFPYTVTTHCITSTCSLAASDYLLPNLAHRPCFVCCFLKKGTLARLPSDEPHVVFHRGKHHVVFHQGNAMWSFFRGATCGLPSRKHHVVFHQGNPMRPFMKETTSSLPAGEPQTCYSNTRSRTLHPVGPPGVNRP